MARDTREQREEGGGRSRKAEVDGEGPPFLSSWRETLLPVREESGWVDIEPSLPGDPQGSPGEGMVRLPRGNRTDSKRTHAQKGASAWGWAPRIMALEEATSAGRADRPEAQESGRRMSGPREGRLASLSGLHGPQPYPRLRTAGLTRAHLIQKHLAAPLPGGRGQSTWSLSAHGLPKWTRGTQHRRA